MGWVLALSSTRGANSRWKHSKKTPTFKYISSFLPHRINPPNLVCTSVQAVPLRIRPWLFYFQPGPGGTGGATSPTTLQCTQPKVDQPKSLLWWAKPLKTKFRCENKQSSVLEAKRVQGNLWVATCAAFCFLKTEEEASSTIVWSRDQNDRKQTEHQANVRHFELLRKRIAACMRTCQCMSHFVYNLRSRPLMHDLAARVRGQIASDHCRSDLITGRTHRARRGTPFLKLIYLRSTSQRADSTQGTTGLTYIMVSKTHKKPSWYSLSPSPMCMQNDGSG